MGGGGGAKVYGHKVKKGERRGKRDNREADEAITSKIVPAPRSSTLEATSLNMVDRTQELLTSAKRTEAVCLLIVSRHMQAYTPPRETKVLPQFAFFLLYFFRPLF